MAQHVLLVGLPGSGKTTVGRLVAGKLGAGFVDFDLVITRKMGMPIARVFGEVGEVKFREIERKTAESAFAGPPSIIAPGGGWAAQPGQLEAAKASCFTIYIKVLATTAAQRAGGDGTRPLLAGADPVVAMRELLKEREPLYLTAHAQVKGDNRTAEAVALDVVALAKQHAGW
ncbi:MAG TPA: shikimate kinase [Gemmatimonadales bacterium]|nr:shikimate kinase [Gemmatimonadales bacterium]